ncbi:heavy metal translocating P-type ATPase [Thermithiobacillus plumbiphilus]|uniref:Heavy metal translocating P-type ATPase n=1 Tax=Thermithiobacillus plumbiphilus TaxID=1729899 RepID=A0ABU9D9M5_9PROT
MVPVVTSEQQELAGTAPEACFHCGLPNPSDARYQARVDGATREFCCAGCLAVAQAIESAGLGEYYRHRSKPADRAELLPDFLQSATLYDDPLVQKSFVRSAGEHEREAALILEGITCAACVWLNERHLRSLPGVLEANINYSTQRASVRWDDRQLHLSDIIQAIAAIGYHAHPYDPGRQAEVLERERRGMLRRLFVAGLSMAQVMMLAVALYAGAYYGMSPEMAEFFRYVSLIFTLPVVFYSAWPFFLGAWRDLKRFQPGMDVPVSLGIIAAFAASVWATLQQAGQVYYDTVTMFVFLLLGARFLEMSARRRASHAVEALNRVMPALARRESDGQADWVALGEVRPGDILLVQPGETIPLDGEVLEGQSDVDESLLTGESRPVPKYPGAQVIGGTINQDGPLRLKVLRVGEDLVISHIGRLLERAQAERPPIAHIADRTARWFVSAVLLLAAAAGIGWYMVDPAKAYWVVVAVLVVTCPCALGLATPVAITAATGRLAREGVVSTRGHALEAMAHVTHLIFDKTGTLTEGRHRLHHAHVQGDEDAAWSVVAALVRLSEHPLSRALQRSLQGRTLAAPSTSEPVNYPGQGMEAQVGQRCYRLGQPAFVEALAGPMPAQWQPLQQAYAAEGMSLVACGSSEGWLGLFALGDQLREDAGQTVQLLQARGYTVWLLSGDHEGAVARAASETGIRYWRAAQGPEDKLQAMRELQQSGAVICMVGDGINDAPVLAGAQVSIAMGAGTAVAQAGADLILLSNRLLQIPATLDLASRTLRLIRQNIGWAIGYNVVALPLAISGWLTPWMAAIGMSLSSLIVVANALRLTGGAGKGQLQAEGKRIGPRSQT